MQMRTVILALTVALLSGGCTPRHSIREPVRVLDVAGPVAIDVRTFGGDVTIRAEPGFERAEVRITRASTHGYLRKDEAEAAIETIGYSIELVSGDVGQVLQVRTTTTHPEPHYQKASVEIRVPEAIGITVRTGAGEVTAIGVAGAIDIESTKGDVVVATPRPLVEPIRIAADTGDIDLRMRGESAGEIDIDTQNGTAYYRCRFGQSVIHPGTDQDTILASFNEGTNPINLRTNDGDIRFVVVDDPLTYGLLKVE